MAGGSDGGQTSANGDVPPLELVSWDRAIRVASRMAGRQAPLSAYERRSLEDDFEELTAQAEKLVEAETGLRSMAGAARARVADRSQWVGANVASFQRLLRPVLQNLAERTGQGRGHWSPLPVSASRQVSGAQMGLVLGWMSARVLGQYDLLLIEDDTPEEQDIVYYVGPNVLSVERRYGFPSREFRLWLALHEVTHRVQFTGVPWLRPHFLSLVERVLSGIDPDPKQLLAALRRTAEAIRAGHNPLDEGGLAAVIAGPEQFEAIQQVGGLMSLLEGHGDMTMDRAGADVLPSAALFGQTLKERRRQRGPAKLLASLMGIDAKLRQYEQGERFIQEVEAAGGRSLFERVWEGPEWLPSWPEIRDPSEWVARAQAAAAPA